MARGDHLYVNRGLYEHHGVDIGEGWVVHFAGTDGTKGGAAVLRSRIEDFAGAGVVEVRDYGHRLDADQPVVRAESMLGRSGYDLFSNNCEHFATWCVAGEHSSAQVEGAASGAGLVGIGAVVPPLGLGIVSSVGGAAAMSGANLMSGLAAVGGSVVGGMVLLGGASGLAAGGTMCLALRDKPMLPDEERKARRVGRYAAIGGGAFGVGVAVQTVGALGVAGYSAAGLTSGLAALGATLGGGMAYGVMATLLIPVLFATGIGYLLYRAARWFLVPQPGRGAPSELAALAG